MVDKGIQNEFARLDMGPLLDGEIARIVIKMYLLVIKHVFNESV
jgi:hypothetical protein